MQRLKGNDVMNAQTLLIVVILVIVLIPAITSAWKHMRGGRRLLWRTEGKAGEKENRRTETAGAYHTY